MFEKMLHHFYTKSFFRRTKHIYSGCTNSECQKRLPTHDLGSRILWRDFIDSYNVLDLFFYILLQLTIHFKPKVNASICLSKINAQKTENAVHIDVEMEEGKREPWRHSTKPPEWMWQITTDGMVLPDLP